MVLKQWRIAVEGFGYIGTIFVTGYVYNVTEQWDDDNDFDGCMFNAM